MAAAAAAVVVVVRGHGAGAWVRGSCVEVLRCVGSSHAALQHPLLDPQHALPTFCPAGSLAFLITWVLTTCSTATYRALPTPKSSEAVQAGVDELRVPAAAPVGRSRAGGAGGTGTRPSSPLSSVDTLSSSGCQLPF